MIYIMFNVLPICDSIKSVLRETTDIWVESEA